MLAVIVVKPQEFGVVLYGGNLKENYKARAKKYKISFVDKRDLIRHICYHSYNVNLLEIALKECGIMTADFKLEEKQSYYFLGPNRIA